MRNCSPYRISVETYYLLRGEIKHNQGIKNRPLGSDLSVTCENPNGMYVLAIGESLAYNHLSLNGIYSRQTTPQLQDIKDLYLLNNYYSTAMFTQQSLPLLLTPSTPETFDMHYSQPTLFSIFKEAGYHTLLITHQEQILTQKRNAYLAEDADSIIVCEHDREIVTNFQRIVEKVTPTFVVLHFLGNHFFYSNYPEEYNQWEPNYTFNREQQSDSLFINAYDNSILYTDSLLAACVNTIKSIDSLPTTFMFISDHGELLTQTVGGHGFSYNPEKSEYHVPCICYFNDNYVASNTGKIDNLNAHIDSPINGDNIFWSVLDMAGIQIDSTLQQDGMSIFGDTLLPHKRTLLLPDGKSIKEL